MEDISQYTYSGVIAWMEGEWRKFHKEREEWTTEKALLCASVDQLRRMLRATKMEEEIANKKIKILEAKVTEQGGSPQELYDAVPHLNRRSYTSTMFENDYKSLPPIKIDTDVPLEENLTPCATTSRHINNQPLPKQTHDAWSEKKEARETTQLHQTDHTNSELSPNKEPRDSDISSRSSSPSSVTTEVHTTAATAPKHKKERSHRLRVSTTAPITPDEVGPPSPQANQLIVPPTNQGNSSGTSKQWELRATVRGHFASVRCGSWCGDGTLMLTGGDDHVVKLWDAKRVLKGKEREEPITTFRGHTSPVLAVHAHKDEVIAAAADGSIRLWVMPTSSSSSTSTTSSHDSDKNQGQIGGFCVLREHTDAVWGLSVLAQSDPGELCFGSVGADGRMLLWRRWSGERSNIAPEVHYSPTPSMGAGSSFTPIHCHVSSTRFIVTYTHLSPTPTSPASGIAVFTKTSAVLTWQCEVTSRPTCLAMHPSGKVGGIGTQDGKLQLFDPSDGSIISCTGPHTAPITSIDFAQDVAFTVSHDGTALALSLDRTSKIIQKLPSPHTHRLGECVNVILYHPGRGIVVTTGADSSIAWYTGTK